MRLLWLCCTLVVATILISQPEGSQGGRVIYYNTISANQTVKNVTEEAMLLSVNRSHCRRGFMHDHHGRCRRIV
ncbi:uncharacterized protein Dwil_GK25569 [Drosophila willistoni]|uniref:Uncharacterized protein n=1 Tax=Drosophila willistoni TaxID=7260 RepID=B4NE36_DROWI|nr:uncharacterized protein LOC6649016 [Drosophila willistoni]EDW82005.1 uncharacterized protein Dwil_GK25569 [Drosophila willistoni]